MSSFRYSPMWESGVRRKNYIRLMPAAAYQDSNHTNLVEIENTGDILIQCNGVTSTLAELLTGRCCEQRHGDTEHAVRSVSLRFRAYFADQIDACEDIAPLVRSAQLNSALRLCVQHVEVVSLQHLVRELRERDTLLRVQPRLDTMHNISPDVQRKGRTVTACLSLAIIVFTRKWMPTLRR